MMTSAAETPSPLWMSVGMPRPSSRTVHRAVGIEHDIDRRRVARERLVDGVVDDFVDHVVQAGAVIGVADVHAGPLANGVEPLQHLDRFSVVSRRRSSGGSRLSFAGQVQSLSGPSGECLDAVVAHLLALLDCMTHVGQNNSDAGLRTASLRSRRFSVAKSGSIVVKICGEGVNVTSVPRWPLARPSTVGDVTISPSANAT